MFYFTVSGRTAMVGALRIGQRLKEFTADCRQMTADQKQKQLARANSKHQLILRGLVIANL
jgi:hypothetical protein